MNSRRQNILSVLGFLAVVAFIFLLSPRNRERVQNGFLSMISPFLKEGSDWHQKWRIYREKVKSLKDLEIETAQLKVENDRLKALNQALQGVEAENLRLKTAIGYQGETPFTLVPARVIGRNESNWWSTITIDRGTNEGLDREMPVITPDGLVGRIIAVSNNSAKILLVTDENCRVAAKLRDGGGQEQHGIIGRAKGDRVAQDALTLGMIDRRVKIQPGWQVVTSGMSHRYPENIPIGTVIHVNEGAQRLDTEAVLKPAVNIASLTDVFVVTGLKGAAAK